MSRREVLTDKVVAVLKPIDGKGRRVADAQVPGLGVRVMPTGVRTWQFRYRSPELPDRPLRAVSLGEYPEVSLRSARSAALDLRREIRSGADPLEREEREREERRRRRDDTVAVLAERFLKDYAARRYKDGGHGARWSVEKHVLPAWGDRPVASIERRDVRELVAAYARRAPVGANRLRALLSKMFAWAVSQDLLDVSPVVGVENPTEERSRNRVLSDDEVKTFWRLTEPRDLGDPDDERMDPIVSAFWRLRLVTAQRRAEVGGMRWEELDLEAGWWTIPAERSKNDEPHRVPLTGLALEVLATVPRIGANPYVLAGAVRRKGQHAPVGGKRLNEAAVPIREAIPDFRGHDLRRTAGTIMASALGGGDGWFITGRVLNHNPPRGSTGVYVRSSYDREKRVALEALERRLRAIVEGDRAVAEVVPIGRKGGRS